MEALREHGYTEHCRQCDHIRAFSEAKGGLAHSEVCRARIVAAMKETAAGALRVREADKRLDRALLEHVAADDAAAVPPTAVPPTAVPSASAADDRSARRVAVSGVVVSTPMAGGAIFGQLNRSRKPAQRPWRGAARVEPSKTRLALSARAV